MTPLICPTEAPCESFSSTMKRSNEYRDGNEVIRPTNPCILTRYGKATETNCADGAGWMGIPRGDQGKRHRSGAETGGRRTDQEVSIYFDSYLWAICRLARRTNGQQRSGAHEHGRGEARAHGHYSN